MFLMKKGLQKFFRGSLRHGCQGYSAPGIMTCYIAEIFVEVVYGAQDAKLLIRNNRVINFEIPNIHNVLSSFEIK
jgi:hypothetical protein